MSDEPAVSSGAILQISRSAGSPGRSFAPVKAAISPVVNSQSAVTKSRISPGAFARGRDQNFVPPPKEKNCVRSYDCLAIGYAKSKRSGPNGESQIKLAPTEARTA